MASSCILDFGLVIWSSIKHFPVVQRYKFPKRMRVIVLILFEFPNSPYIRYTRSSSIPHPSSHLYKLYARRKEPQVRLWCRFDNVSDRCHIYTRRTCHYFLPSLPATCVEEYYGAPEVVWYNRELIFYHHVYVMTRHLYTPHKYLSCIGLACQIARIGPFRKDYRIGYIHIGKCHV